CRVPRGVFRAGNEAVISMNRGAIMSPQTLKFIMTAVFALCALATAAAQAPAYGPNISLDDAKKAAAAALAEARKNNWTMAVAIVDTAGVLVYYEKMDNTQNGSADVSVNKARSAARFKRPTKAFQDALAAGGAGLRVLGIEGAVPVEGGLPLFEGGKIVGGIGLSGGA